ncbi:MAG: hypothetical protein O3A94_14000 [Proteobacteria bacterium]|nr:hypothetical protein [Pseudomonadota bacterium]
MSNSERVVTRLGTADRRESNEADRRESDEANRRDSTMLRDDGAGDGINV